MRRKPRAKSVCFYFQVHQPLRLSKFSFFDIENKSSYDDYFLGKHDTELKQKISRNLFPVSELLLTLLNSHPEFKFSLSISGLALEVFEMVNKEFIESLQDLVATKRVELLGETYHNSLSWVYSKEEFVNQVIEHRKIIWKYFKKKPKVFKNTALNFDLELIDFVRRLGFEGAVASIKDDSEQILEILPYKLDKELVNLTFKHRFRKQIKEKMGLLVVNREVSNLFASSKVLDIDNFISKIEALDKKTVNVYLDFDSIGTSVSRRNAFIKFFEELPERLAQKGIVYRTAAEAVHEYKAKELKTNDGFGKFSVNSLQQEALEKIYEIEKTVNNILHKQRNKKKANAIINTWRRLQSIEHFDNMDTNDWDSFEKGKKQFESPYDAYINYMNVLSDFTLDLEKVSNRV